MPILLDDMPEMVTEVLDDVPHDIVCVMVIGLDMDGDLYFDDNIGDTETVSKMFQAAIENFKRSLD